MEHAADAFTWIIGILEKRNVVYQLTGGFAAKIYGATRPLRDIDIDISDADFPKIAGDVARYIVSGPRHLIDERWDCMLMTLDYSGQLIDISGGDSMKICDARTGVWVPMPADFVKSIRMEVFGRVVPVVHPDDLIEYKRMLVGEHQEEDINAVSARRAAYI